MKNDYYLQMDAVKSSGQPQLRIFLNQVTKYDPHCITGFVLYDDKVNQVENMMFKEAFGSDFMKQISQNDQGQIVLEYKDGEKHHRAEFPRDVFFGEFNKVKQFYDAMVEPNTRVLQAPVFKAVAEQIKHDQSKKVLVLNDILMEVFKTDKLKPYTGLYVVEGRQPNLWALVAYQKADHRGVSNMALVGHVSKEYLLVTRNVLINGQVIYNPVTSHLFRNMFKLEHSRFNLFSLKATKRSGRLKNIIQYTERNPDVGKTIDLPQTNELTNLLKGIRIKQ